MHKNILLAVGITILFLGTCITPSVAIDNSIKPISNGNTLYVGGTGPGNYTKIQDAINDSSDGDTVFVYAYSSPYYERLKVTKSINLIGEDRETTVIDGSRSRSGVLIYDADEVYISGFTIQNCDSELYTYVWGIHIYSDFNTITGNIITKNRGGVSLDNSNGNIITGNTISYNEGGLGTGDSFSNIINKNNFLYNTEHASFINYVYEQPIPIPNIWHRNYWNRTRILPKLIIGLIVLIIYPFPFFIPWFNIDWHPAKEQYDI